MTLISILLGLALEYFLGPMDRFRNFQWFDKYYEWLELKCRKLPYWDSAVGVIIILTLPTIILLLAHFLLDQVFIGLSFILSILIFVYCLGPDVNILLTNYIQALEGDIKEDIVIFESITDIKNKKNQYDEVFSISGILVRTHDCMFGVLFWFIVLGMTGALIFSLTLVLRKKREVLQKNLYISVEDLYRILIWPSARLLAISFAIGGSLVDTLEKWRKVEGGSMSASQDVIVESGLGALQYQKQRSSSKKQAKSNYIQYVKEVQALINRSLVVWLTILGLMTLGGVLS